MKNKEIEKLLNDMRHSYKIHEEIIKKYNNADKISYPYTINLKQINLLLSYIEQLENNRDKAIEYIEKYRTYTKIGDNDYLKSRDDFGDLDRWQVFELIDILKGDSDV